MSDELAGSLNGPQPRSSGKPVRPLRVQRHIHSFAPRHVLQMGLQIVQKIRIHERRVGGQLAVQKRIDEFQFG